jgi:hypothetical protein
MSTQGFPSLKQIQDLHVAQREEDIGFYAGFLGKIVLAHNSQRVINNKVHACIFVGFYISQLIEIFFLKSQSIQKNNKSTETSKFLIN